MLAATAGNREQIGMQRGTMANVIWLKFTCRLAPSPSTFATSGPVTARHEAFSPQKNLFGGEFSLCFALVFLVVSYYLVGRSNNTLP
jgi:hypothetical protein